MTCYSPLIRIENITKYETAQDGHKYHPAQIYGAQDEEYLKMLYPDTIISKTGRTLHKTAPNYKKTLIPCGKCIGCRLAYSKNWATRAMLEAQNYEQNYFLTITYDDEHKPYENTTFSHETGEIFCDDGTWNGTLKPEDMTLFMKRIRTHWKRKYEAENIRFMYCGEYGGKTERPHYHAIMFNFPIKPEMLKFWKYNGLHEPLYICPELEKLWGKGYIVVGEVSWSSCAYVARYVTKKIGLPANQEYYAAKGQEPEYMRVSRMPGIGREWYEMNKEQLHEFDQILMHKYNGEPIRVRPPKYYDKLYDLENPEEMEKLKRKRKRQGENAIKLKMKKTSLGPIEQLKIEEEQHKKQTAKLKRVIEN